jgi:AcrR family transcriptional regulator
MSESQTEEKLIKAISNHHLGEGNKRLTIQMVSESVGISRQAFNRYYKHLKPYVLGKRPIGELLKNETSDLTALIASCQNRIRELQDEVKRLLDERDAHLEGVRQGYITTLMCGDITLNSHNEIRTRLEKQALHNEVLVRDKRLIEAELTAAMARETELSRQLSAGSAATGDIVALTPDLTEALRHFVRTGDIGAFEVAKDAAMENLLKKINTLCRPGGVKVVLVVDRYLINFEKHVDRVRVQLPGTVAIVRTPILSRPELKMFAGKIMSATSISVHFPVSSSESVSKAQRHFLFRNVPSRETEAADRMSAPTVQDGFEEVLMVRVRQGE